MLRRAEPDVSTLDLIEALEIGDRLGDLATLHVLDSLVDRGPAALEEVSATLLADPLSNISGYLAEVLVDVQAAYPAVRERVRGVLAHALSSALTRGAGIHGGAGELVQYLAEVAIGSVGDAGARAAALQYLPEAARDPVPFAPGASAARKIVEAEATPT